MAYTRFGSLRETAMPMRPSPSVGRPSVSCFQVVPPSVDLYNPLPGPFDGGYTFHGGRRVCHNDAYIVFESVGSKARSIAAVSLSLCRMGVQVFPPSVERKTPRSTLGPKA